MRRLAIQSVVDFARNPVINVGDSERKPFTEREFRRIPLRGELRIEDDDQVDRFVVPEAERHDAVFARHGFGKVVQ